MRARGARVRLPAGELAILLTLVGAAPWSGPPKLDFRPPVADARSAGRAATTDTGSADTASVSDLPTHEVSTTPTRGVLAVLMTGDGGWVAGDKGLARALAAQGVPVVGLDARRYLSRERTPDEVARDLERLLGHYRAAWGVDRAAVIGYSRGADIVPFMVARLPDPLRQRVALVALLGPSEWAGFEFHLIDLVRNVHRSGDLPVRPEIERLRGTPVLCIYGSDDRGSICRSLDPTLARSVLRDGGAHRIGGDEGPALARVLLDALARTPPP